MGNESRLVIRGARPVAVRVTPRPPSSPALLEADHYVATDGVASGPGTIDAPWSLAYAASGAGGTLAGGDKIVDLRAGTYNVQSLSFSADGVIGTGVDALDGKIVYRAFPGERPIIWGNTASTSVDDIQFNGDFNWFVGLEFIGKHWTERLASHTGGATCWLNGTQDGIKFVHCFVHDGDDNFFIEQGVGRAEIYGCINFNPGNDTNPRGHGHYIHHADASGTKDLVIEGNVVFNSFGFLIQAYDGGSAGNSEGIKIRRNVLFGQGTLNTTPHWSAVVFDNSADDIRRCTFTDNWIFALDANAEDAVMIGAAAHTTQMDILGNCFFGSGGDSAFGGIYLEGPPAAAAGSLKFKDNFVHVAGTGNRLVCRINLTGTELDGLDWDDNEIIRDPAATAWRQDSTSKTFATWKTDTGKGANDTATATAPSTNKYFVEHFDKFSALGLCRKHGVVAYRNYEGLSSIPIDLSPILSVGEEYEIFDAREAFPDSTPVLTGTYGGGTINFPNTQADDPAAIGGSPSTPPDTAPHFNAFIVRTV